MKLRFNSMVACLRKTKRPCSNRKWKMNERYGCQVPSGQVSLRSLHSLRLKIASLTVICGSFSLFSLFAPVKPLRA
jgi:hypothetical protein